MTQQDLPGVVRTQEELHTAVNVVIEAAQAAAVDQRVTMVIAVAGSDGRALTVGVDFRRGFLQLDEVLRLAAMAQGAMQVYIAEHAAGIADSGVAFGLKNAEALFDRERFHPPEKDVAGEETVAAEEAELSRVLQWLRAHERFSHQGIVAALEARDHRQGSQGGDERTEAIERRFDILDLVHRASPLRVSQDRLMVELEIPQDLDSQLQFSADIEALRVGGLIWADRTTCWIADDFDDELVGAGLRMLAARSVPSSSNRRSTG